jgi:hypothetical protein
VAFEKHRVSLCLRVLLFGIISAGAALGQRTITCSSDNGGRNFCSADTRRGVELIRQRSGSPCIQGRTWGWDRQGIWVDRGCRADFALGRGGEGYRPGRPGRPVVQTITCSSDNGKRNWCPNPMNGEVRLIRQRSGSPCRRGSTWGTQPGSIWVDRGCRADFEIRTGRR